VDDGAAPRGSQAITRAMGVLGAFTRERAALTATEIATAIDVSVPTAHRIAKALENQGYLTRNAGSKAFSLGPEILRLARLMTDSHATETGARALAAIREATGETVSLHIRVGDRRVCIAEEVSRQTIRITSGVGKSYPLTAGAAGKAILSQLPDDEVERLVGLPRDPDARPLPRAKLLSAVRQARELGYTTSEGETVPGSIAVAVPLPWSDSGAPSAINLVAPRDRMTRAAMTRGLAAIHAAIAPLRGDRPGA
jgi:DNA-binding IclR family transcriptional regulator